MAKELPSPELLRKLLRYEPETGKLFWREREPSVLGEALSHCKVWNRKHAFKETMTTRDAKGHLRGWLLGVQMPAHKVIWAIVYGRWPSGIIKHANGDAGDNRIANLVATKDEDRLKLLGTFASKAEAGDAWASADEGALGCRIVARDDGKYEVWIGVGGVSGVLTAPSAP